MPYNINWLKNGVHWEFHGKVCRKDLENVTDTFYQKVDEYHLKYQIVDLSDVTVFHLTDKDAIRTAAIDFGGSKYVREMRFAVIGQNEAVIGIVSKYIEVCIKLGSPWEFGGFDSFEGAMQWCIRPMKDPEYHFE